MQKTISEIVEVMLKELGTPDSKTELDSTLASKQWTKAFNDFNKRVGKWCFRTFTCVADQQRYSMKELFPDAKIYDIKNVFRPSKSLVDNYLTVTNTFYYAEGSLVTPFKEYDDIAFLRAMYNVPDYEFIFSEPDTLVLVQTPKEADTILIVTQEDYTTTTLPDDYEAVISEYCKEFYCQEIIRKARMRLATPLRNGDFIKYPVSHAKEKSFTEDAKNAFINECDRLIESRMIK